MLCVALPRTRLAGACQPAGRRRKPTRRALAPHRFPPHTHTLSALQRDDFLPSVTMDPLRGPTGMDGEDEEDEEDEDFGGEDGEGLEDARFMP